MKVPLKASPGQPDWVKVCDEDPAAKKTVCLTSREFVAENNQPVMGIAIYQVKDDPRRFARLVVPLTFMIPPGVRLSTEGLNPVLVASSFARRKAATLRSNSMMPPSTRSRRAPTCAWTCRTRCSRK